MIGLQDLLYKVALESVCGELQLQIESLAFDSRKVGVNSLFVAIKGEQVDGHQYIELLLKLERLQLCVKSYRQ